MKLTDELRELYRTAFLGGYLQKWEFEQILSSELAWREEAERLRKEVEEWKIVDESWNQINTNLAEQLNQAVEVLNESKTALKWATEYGHFKTCTCPQCNALGAIEYFLFSLSQEGAKETAE